MSSEPQTRVETLGEQAQRRDIHRATIRVSRELANRLEEIVDAGVYVNKSDLIRDAARVAARNPDRETRTSLWGRCTEREYARIPGELWNDLEDLDDEGYFASPSQAIRDGLRHLVVEHTSGEERGRDV